MSNSEFASLVVERWIKDHYVILLVNFVSLFVACAMGRNPLIALLTWVNHFG